MKTNTATFSDDFLTDNQKLAITTADGPLLIIAGPGSGKTLTLVERAIYLITEKNIAPENLFISTFTEKAASQLITRISNRLLEQDIRVNVNDMYIGTLHSIFLKLLKDHREYTRLPKSFRLFEPFDQVFFIYQHMRRFEEIEAITELLGPHTTPRWRKANLITELISKVAEELIDPDDLLNHHDLNIQLLGQVYQVYEHLLDELKAIDFTHIQVETHRLLRDYPQVLRTPQQQIRYMMIDFYYDGAVLEPSVVDIPEEKERVQGEYPVPKDAGTIRVKITDLLSESLEVDVA